jgi:hypothetical protein
MSQDTIESAARAWVEASHHAGKEALAGGYKGTSADEIIRAHVGTHNRHSAARYRAYETAVHARAREIMGEPPERAVRNTAMHVRRAG